MATSAVHRVAGNLWVRRLQRRLGAIVVATSLIGVSLPVTASAAPTQEEIGRMYGEGQDYMEQKEFKRAAEVFTRLLNLIEESADNKAIRESLILNILDAHMQAYEGIVGADGKRDVEQLREGKATLQAYYKDFQAVHGDSVAVIAEIQTSANRLDALLSKAEDDETPVPEPVVTPEDGSTQKDDTPPPVVVQSSGGEGLGFLLGGVGLAVLGIGTAVMIPVGAISSGSANDDYEEADAIIDNPSSTETEVSNAMADRDDAEERGQRGNAIAISGGVLTPLLLGGAVALIVIGVKRRKRSMASTRTRDTLTATPAFGRGPGGRNFSGFTLQGRF